MSRTFNLRRQHDTALELVDQIARQTSRMGDRPTRDQAFGVSLLLGRLAGLLRIHFAQEDKSLYPSLIAADGESGHIAQQFAREMGEIGPKFEAFIDQWCSSEAILKNAPGFRNESSRLFTALADRIERENEILYPLVEPTSLQTNARVA